MRRITTAVLVVVLGAGVAVACDPCGGMVGASALYAPRAVMYAPVVQQAPVYTVQAAPVYAPQVQAAPVYQAAPCQSAAVQAAPVYVPQVQAAPVYAPQVQAAAVVQYAVPSVPLAAVVVRQQAVTYAPAVASAVVVRQAAPVRVKTVAVQAAPVRSRGLFGGLFRGRSEAAQAGGGQAVQQRGLINLNR